MSKQEDKSFIKLIDEETARLNEFLSDKQDLPISHLMKMGRGTRFKWSPRQKNWRVFDWATLDKKGGIIIIMPGKKTSGGTVTLRYRCAFTCQFVFNLPIDHKFIIAPCQPALCADAP